MNKLRSILLTIIIFSLFLTPANAEPQRVTCPSGNFSIIAPQGWTLIVEEEDLLVFQNTSKEALMSFKKMPEKYPDLETFVTEYKNALEENQVKVSAQGTQLINEIEALKFNIEIEKTDPQDPDMQGQVFMLISNNDVYFFEAFGQNIISGYSAVFEGAAKSFKLK